MKVHATFHRVSQTKSVKFHRDSRCLDQIAREGDGRIFASNGATTESCKNPSCYEALLFSLENSMRNGSNPTKIRRSTSLEKHIPSPSAPPPSAVVGASECTLKTARVAVRKGEEGRVSGCRTIDRGKGAERAWRIRSSSPARWKEIRASSARVFRSTRIIRPRNGIARDRDRNSRTFQSATTGNRSSTCETVHFRVFQLALHD